VTFRTFNKNIYLFGEIYVCFSPGTVVVAAAAAVVVVAVVVAAVVAAVVVLANFFEVWTF